MKLRCTERAAAGLYDSAQPEPVAWSLFANLLPQALLGVVWGYLYIRTGNIWGAWLSHTLTNSAVNFVHVRSAAGIDTGLSVRMATFTLAMLLGLVLIKRLSDAYGLPSVAPWGSS
jgi:membrane protease YdiL (CAAX protease family)